MWREKEKEGEWMQGKKRTAVEGEEGDEEESRREEGGDSGKGGLSCLRGGGSGAAWRRK